MQWPGLEKATPPSARNCKIQHRVWVRNPPIRNCKGGRWCNRYGKESIRMDCTVVAVPHVFSFFFFASLVISRSCLKPFKEFRLLNDKVTHSAACTSSWISYISNDRERGEMTTVSPEVSNLWSIFVTEYSGGFRFATNIRHFTDSLFGKTYISLMSHYQFLLELPSCSFF